MCNSPSRELRALVVEMVLATDMSCHFQQVKAMKNFLQQPEGSVSPLFCHHMSPFRSHSFFYSTDGQSYKQISSLPLNKFKYHASQR